MQNNNQKPVPEGLKVNFITQLRQMRDSLPTPPAFSPSERKVIQTMNESRKPFVEKSLIYAETLPSILPPFVTITELKMDITAFSDYTEMLREYDLLGQKLRDLMFAAGSDCYFAALSIYNSAKLAARSGLSEAKPVVSDLKTLFAGQGSIGEEAGELTETTPIVN